MNTVHAIILAIIEGLTEFLPISSTGHMVIASAFMGIASNDFVKMFTVAIQFGAILSVLVLYWKKFLQSLSFYYKLFVAFIPAAVFGFLLNDYIDALLDNAWVVGVNLILGGIFLLFVDRLFAKNEDPNVNQEINFKKAFIIGCYQVIAMIPGVSRSAASIVGGLTQQLNRKNAAEFSFFLAVPTMLAATAYKMLKYYLDFGFEKADLGLLALGNVLAFVVALIAIKGFIGFLTKYGFKFFAYYRILAGAILLALLAMGFGVSEF
ncbi:MAG: undecaprenyl-diphosphate phosphatase [Chitinophagales bacterium]|nr:undecaprenyl-diphosphate phosphatase [Chitinophagales bacterium]